MAVTIGVQILVYLFCLGAAQKADSSGLGPRTSREASIFTWLL
jgi:hypothetical protein